MPARRKPPRKSRQSEDLTAPIHAYGNALAAEAKARFDEIQEIARRKYESGESVHLFKMIYICTCTNMPLPEWAARAFQVGWQSLMQAGGGTLDEAFGRPFKGKHAMGGVGPARVHSRITQLRNEEECAGKKKTPVTKLFESVGREFGIGSDECRELYYEFNKIAKNIKEATGIYIRV